MSIYEKKWLSVTRVLALFAGLLLTGQSATADDRLLVTDTVPPREIEIKGEFSHVRSKSDYTVVNSGQAIGAGQYRSDSSALALSLRTGISSRSDLQVSVPYFLSYNRTATGISALDTDDGGIKDLSIQARYRVLGGNGADSSALTLGLGAILKASGYAKDTTLFVPSIHGSFKDPASPLNAYIGYSFLGSAGSGNRSIHRGVAGVRGAHWPSVVLDVSLGADFHSAYDSATSHYDGHAEYLGKLSVIAKVRDNLYLVPYAGGVAFSEEKARVKGSPIEITVQGRGGFTGGVQLLYYVR